MDQFSDFDKTEQHKEAIDINNIVDKPLDTDVQKLSADAYYERGMDKFPIFDVTKGEFFDNMSADRRRVRFASGSKAQQYSRDSRYKNPFYVRFKDENGKQYIRRVK